MSTPEQITCKSVNEKLSGYIDGELTQQDTQLVRVHVQQCERCQSTLNDLLAMRGQMKSSLLENSDHALSAIVNDKQARVLQWIGWPLLIIGLLTITGYASWQYLTDPLIPLWFRVATSSVVAGSLILLIAVLRQRLIARKTDKYKEVKL